MMTDLREYIVTAKDWNTLDSLCEDIESEGGDLYIPNRRVEVALERPISRNTHYYLSEAEAEQLRNDPRVLAVELTPTELGIHPVPTWTQESDFWDKSNQNDARHRNWGLLRCTLGENIWAFGETTKSGTVQVNAEGRHVDVVIVDGLLDPNHPEFAVNPDGTGGSRVIQYDWFKHSAQVEGVARSTPYTYTPYVDNTNTNLTGQNNHGCHVGGTVAGNTQGWARRANIYNISPFNVNGVGGELVFDYIRAFHAAKPINPITKRKNPTIINNSWGWYPNRVLTSISSIIYRGTKYLGPFTAAKVADFGLRTFTSAGTVYVMLPYRVAAADSDVQDLISAGVIVVGAAGNVSTLIDKPGGPDYNNSVNISTMLDLPYHRGSSPTAAENAICVGAIGTTADEKASFSNCGPRIDIYSPGTQIMSSVHSDGIADPRNTTYQLKKYDGTSMASPQVCGVLACALETYPNMTQAQAMQYLKTHGKVGQIYETTQDYFDLEGSDNRFLYYYEERKDNGNVWPKTNYSFRVSSKLRFPRTRIRKSSI